MKITNLQTWYVRHPIADTWKPQWLRGGSNLSLGDINVAKVITDEGLVGWGTCFDFRGFANPAYPANAKRIQEELGPRVVGMDPFQFEQLTEIFNNSVRQGINPWALDLALWDIVGKAAGQPVYKLLGGHKDRVIPYASCTNDYELEERVEAIQRLIDEGWKAAKIHIVPDLPIMDNLKLITAVRKAAGDKMRIAVDTHQYGNFPKWGLQGALTFGRELDNMGNFLWMEDCLPRQDYIGMQQLTAALSTPVSCGGISAPLAEIAKLLSTNCLDQIQPGAGCNESVWNLRKMITLCETHYKSYSPHTWCSIDTIAGLHLAAATPSCTYVESHYDPPAQPMMLVNLLLKEPIQFNKDDGTYSVPQTPGWGVDLDEELIERYCER